MMRMETIIAMLSDIQEYMENKADYEYRDGTSDVSGNREAYWVDELELIISELKRRMM